MKLLLIIGLKTTSRSFQYHTKIIGSAPENIDRLYKEVVVALKYLNNFGDLLICLSLTVKYSLICHGQEIV